MAAQSNLLAVDWSLIPAPQDDGGARHLAHMRLAAIALPATDGRLVDLGALAGRTVVFLYPMTGRPGVPLPDGWDGIPGARGCTPQSCAFRDHYGELRACGAENVFGLSTQDSSYQREAVERLHLPYALLSDASLKLARAMRFPVFAVAETTLLKRMALVLDGIISKVFYPVFPPDRNANDVLTWLREHPL